VTTALLDAPAGGATPPDEPRLISRKPTGGDAIFVNTFRVIGASVLVITSGIGIFLAYQGWPTVHHYGFSFFTTRAWNPDTDTLGIAAVVVGTIEVAAVAMVIAFPLAIATALYITEYAPPRLRSTLVAAIDLMAAVPSIVYGLWGFFLIEPHAS
jgi:phosphate transport system permease protein